VEQLLLAASGTEVEAAKAARLRQLQQQHAQHGSAGGAAKGAAMQPPQPLLTAVPREASSGDVLAAARVLSKSRDLLAELRTRLDNAHAPVGAARTSALARPSAVHCGATWLARGAAWAWRLE
jgi:hypothetical protein